MCIIRFSLDEQALGDVPAFIEHIVQATAQPRVALVGYSLVRYSTTLRCCAVRRVKLHALPAAGGGCRPHEWRWCSVFSWDEDNQHLGTCGRPGGGGPRLYTPFPPPPPAGLRSRTGGKTCMYASASASVHGVSSWLSRALPPPTHTRAHRAHKHTLNPSTQGVTLAMMLLATQPEYARSRVAGLVAIAPVVFVQKISTPLMALGLGSGAAQVGAGAGRAGGDGTNRGN